MSGSSLKLTITLQPGEETLAFLSRLAARNGIASVRGFCADMGLALGGIVEGRGADLSQLADLADVDAMALRTASLTKEGSAFRVRGERLVAASLRRNRFVACPECLKADIAASALRPHVAAFGRLAWRIAALRTCAVHDMAFVELDAGAGVTRHDFAAMVRPHLKRLDDLCREAPRRPASELERYVLRRLDGGRSGTSFLDGLELHVAIRLCEVIGALSVHGRGVHLARLGEDELRFGGAVGIAVAGGGEDGVAVFLRDLQRAYPYGRLVRASPRPPFTEFKAWLAGHARQPSYAPVRSLLIRHLADEKPVDVEDIRRRSILERSAHDYARLMNGCARIIRAGAVNPPIGAPAMAPLPQTIRSDLPSQAMPAQDAACHLTCGMPLFQALVAHGLVMPVEGTWEAGWPHFFERRDLDALLAALLRGAVSVTVAGEGTAGITEAADLTLCAPVEIVGLVLGRRLPWVGRSRGEKGFRSILVKVEEVREAVRIHAIEGPTLTEAAKVLGREHEQIAALVGMGAMSIECGIYAHTGVPVDCATATSIDLFQALNVEVRAVAARMRTNTEEAMTFLSAAGLKATYADARLGFAYFDRREVAQLGRDLELRLPLPWTKNFYRSREWRERSDPR